LSRSPRSAKLPAQITPRDSGLPLQKSRSGIPDIRSEFRSGFGVTPVDPNNVQEEKMRRREALQIIAGVIAFAPDTIAAQTAAKTYRIGTLTVGPPIPPTEGTGKMLVEGLARRGYKLGDNLAYESRGAAGKIPQMANLMQELKAANVDVVVTVGYPSAAAAKASGVSTVIASGSGDPVVTGLVASLAHPGGTVTGIADDAAALSTKRLGLLKAVAPELRRVAMLWNKDDRGMTQRYDASAKAAQELGVTVQPLGVREPDDFNEAFAAMNREMPGAILMVTDSLTLLNRKRVFDFALEHKVPAIYEQDFMARDGGLMSYGADARESFDRAADLAARIFQGAKPADLPVEIPTRYIFVINMKTAKAMNFTMPNNVLSLADEVIE
jgi:putative ABC transport system substrate-binding protein